MTTKPQSSGETHPATCPWHRDTQTSTYSEQQSPHAVWCVVVTSESQPSTNRERGRRLGPQSGTRHYGLWGKLQGVSLAFPGQGLSLGTHLVHPNDPATREVPPAHAVNVSRDRAQGFGATLFRKETKRTQHRQVKLPCREGLLYLLFLLKSLMIYVLHTGLKYQH